MTKIIIKEKSYVVITDNDTKEYCKTKTDLSELMLLFEVPLENIVYQNNELCLCGNQIDSKGDIEHSLCSKCLDKIYDDLEKDTNNYLSKINVDGGSYEDII